MSDLISTILCILGFNSIKHTFYDLNKKKKVCLEVTSKSVIKFNNGGRGYLLRSENKNGTKLTTFVSKSEFDSFDVPII